MEWTEHDELPQHLFYMAVEFTAHSLWKLIVSGNMSVASRKRSTRIWIWCTWWLHSPYHANQHHQLQTLTNGSASACQRENASSHFRPPSSLFTYTCYNQKSLPLLLQVLVCWAKFRTDRKECRTVDIPTSWLLENLWFCSIWTGLLSCNVFCELEYHHFQCWPRWARNANVQMFYIRKRAAIIHSGVGSRAQNGKNWPC